MTEPTIRDLDPAAVRLSPDHDRDMETAPVADLVRSIREVGQQVPVIVRPVGDEWELVCGARRRAAVTKLRLPLRAEVRDLDDEAAFVLRDTENRHRRDLCDLDRARSYAAALRTHYGRNVTLMAQRLGIDRTKLTRLVNMGTLSDTVVAVFPNRAAIRERHARAIQSVRHVPSFEEICVGLEGKARTAREAVDLICALGRPLPPKPRPQTFSGRPGASGIRVTRKDERVSIEFDASIGRTDLNLALRDCMDRRYG